MRIDNKKGFPILRQARVSQKEHDSALGLITRPLLQGAGYRVPSKWLVSLVIHLGHL